jgi:hypothetical protein
MAEEWFYTNDGQQMGPVSIAGLRELASKGGLRPSDLVWTEGMSTWAPANATRGLFPSAAGSSTPAPADVPEVKPADRRRFADDREFDRMRERRFDRRTAPSGMSTGTKVLIGLGVAGVLAMVAMVGILVMASVIAETSAQQRYQGGRNRQIFGGGPPIAANGPGGPINPVPPPQNLKVAPAGKKSYEVNLTADQPVEGHLVRFNQGQRVTITVKATKWIPDELNKIDVDLYVYDSKGVLVTFDDGEEKDCLNAPPFIAERTENYTVVVHLCSGASATCKVEY